MTRKRFSLLSTSLLTTATLTIGLTGASVAHPGHGSSSRSSARPVALAARQAPVAEQALDNDIRDAPARRPRRANEATVMKRRAQSKARAKIRSRRQKRSGRQARMDRDGDGIVSDGERLRARAARFARIDQDGDGMITLGELRAMSHRKRTKHKGADKGLRKGANKGLRKGADKGLRKAQGVARGINTGKAKAKSLRGNKARGKSQRGHRRNQGKKMVERFERFDLNQDGTVSWYEFANGPRSAKKRRS
jgi:hypothetical protein